MWNRATWAHLLVSRGPCQATRSNERGTQGRFQKANSHQPRIKRDLRKRSHKKDQNRDLSGWEGETFNILFKSWKANRIASCIDRVSFYQAGPLAKRFGDCCSKELIPAGLTSNDNARVAKDPRTSSTDSFDGLTVVVTCYRVTFKARENST